LAHGFWREDEDEEVKQTNKPGGLFILEKPLSQRSLAAVVESVSTWMEYSALLFAFDVQIWHTVRSKVCRIP